MNNQYRIVDLFMFDDRRTVIVVEMEDEERMHFPLRAAVMHEGRLIKEVTLTSERMPGPSSAGRRALETWDVADVDDDLLRSGRCALHIQGMT